MKLLSGRLEIVNRSDWPDWALKVICPWIVKRAGIVWNYQIVLRDTKKNTWRGRGWRHKQTSVVHRRYSPSRQSCCHEDWFKEHYRKIGEPEMLKYRWPYKKLEWRFKTINFEFELNSRLELLVYLLAHEAHHANEGHPEKWRKSGGSRQTDRRYMELDCNEFGANTVKEFRENWPYFLSKLRESYQAEKGKKVEKKDPSLVLDKKISHINDMKTKWEKKAKFAQNKIKKYNKQAKYYENRLAAIRGNDGD